MDIRTGRTYETREDALETGVPESDIAEVETRNGDEPLVRFKSGPFKGRTYRRTRSGLVRVDHAAPIRGTVLERDDKGELTRVQ